MESGKDEAAPLGRASILSGHAGSAIKGLGRRGAQDGIDGFSFIVTGNIGGEVKVHGVNSID